MAPEMTVSSLAQLLDDTKFVIAILYSSLSFRKSVMFIMIINIL